MKQKITIEQLRELTEEQKEKLREHWEPKTFDIVLINKYATIIEVSRGCINEYATEDGIIVGIEKEDCLPLLSIGQMIEIIEKDHVLDMSTGLGIKVWTRGDIRTLKSFSIGLCDSLWEAVKSIL